MTARASLLVTSVLIALGGATPAAGSVGGRELVVSCRGEPGELAGAAAAGADGVLLVIDKPGALADPRLDRLVREASDRGLKLWLGARSPEQARGLAGRPVAGLALVLTPPAKPRAKPEGFAALLAAKRQADVLARDVRRLRKALGPDRELAVCCALSETDPQTAGGPVVPLADLVRDGTVDRVCVSGANRFNFHRLRLLRDARLRAGVFVDVSQAEPKAAAGVLRRAVLDSMQNDTCESLWLVGPGAGRLAAIAAETLAAHQRAQAAAEATARAIAEGRLVVDQGVDGKARDNQASVHGVAQSFTPSRDGLCPLVQIFGTLRRCTGPLPPPLAVELRADADGRPGEQVLARTKIEAGQFGHEPTYRWGHARFEPAVKLKKGVTYWIHLPDARHEAGVYLWGLAKDGANERGRAWSGRYDYAKHTWVFRVYLSKEQGE